MSFPGEEGSKKMEETVAMGKKQAQKGLVPRRLLTKRRRCQHRSRSDTCLHAERLYGSRA